MKGIFIENSFYKSKAVDEIYDKLNNAAIAAGIKLDRADNADYIQRIDKLDCFDEFDFCIFWNKDIIMAKALEKRGLKVFNSAQAIEICDNKALTHLMLSDVVPMPHTYLVPFTYENTGYTHCDFLDYFENELGYPYVIKECFGSLGTGVYLAKDKVSAKAIIKKCDGIKLIAQEFVDRLGEKEYSDIRAYFVGNRCVASMQRYMENDFIVNVANGGNVRDYTLTSEEIKLCLLVMKTLDLDFAGIDILHSKNGPLICEVNSNAQFNALEQISRTNVAQAIIDYIIERV